LPLVQGLSHRSFDPARREGQVEDIVDNWFQLLVEVDAVFRFAGDNDRRKWCLFLNFFQQLEFFAIFGLEIHKDNVVGLFADLGLEGERVILKGEIEICLQSRFDTQPTFRGTFIRENCGFFIIHGPCTCCWFQFCFFNVFFVIINLLPGKAIGSFVAYAERNREANICGLWTNGNGLPDDGTGSCPG